MTSDSDDLEALREELNSRREFEAEWAKHAKEEEAALQRAEREMSALPVKVDI